MSAPARRLSPGDRALALALCAAATAWVFALPHHLSETDEALFLYEAKRVLAGEVFYRDIFDIITPGSHYLVAGLFALFGTSMTTARAADALLHGGIVLAVFTCARALRVPPLLAVFAAGAHLVCQAAWPFSSPHWISTGVSMALLWLLLTRPARAGALGLLAGAGVLVQQQHGVVTAAATLAVLLLVPPDDIAPPWHARARAATRFVAGLVAVAMPPMVALAVAVGSGPLLHALVEIPVLGYSRAYSGVGWGSIGIFNHELAAQTLPRLLALLPVPLAASAVRGLLATRRAPATARTHAALVLFALGQIASIAYYADFIHIAFVGAILLVPAIENLEALLARMRRAAPLPAGAVAVALPLALAVQLAREWRIARASCPYTAATAFGTVAFPSPWIIGSIAQVRALLDRSPTRELFSYPFYPALYLLADADNPTPYQFFAAYTPPTQRQAVLDILTRRRTPVVFHLPLRHVDEDDPITRYLRAHYDPMTPDSAILLRRPEPPPSP